MAVARLEYELMERMAARVLHQREEEEGGGQNYQSARHGRKSVRIVSTAFTSAGSSRENEG